MKNIKDILNIFSYISCAVLLYFSQSFYQFGIILIIIDVIHSYNLKVVTSKKISILFLPILLLIIASYLNEVYFNRIGHITQDGNLEVAYIFAFLFTVFRYVCMHYLSQKVSILKNAAQNLIFRTSYLYYPISLFYIKLLTQENVIRESSDYLIYFSSLYTLIISVRILFQVKMIRLNLIVSELIFLSFIFYIAQETKEQAIHVLATILMLLLYYVAIFFYFQKKKNENYKTNYSYILITFMPTITWYVATKDGGNIYVQGSTFLIFLILILKILSNHVFKRFRLEKLKHYDPPNGFYFPASIMISTFLVLQCSRYFNLGVSLKLVVLESLATFFVLALGCYLLYKVKATQKIYNINENLKYKTYSLRKFLESPNLYNWGFFPIMSSAYKGLIFSIDMLHVLKLVLVGTFGILSSVLRRSSPQNRHIGLQVELAILVMVSFILLIAYFYFGV